MRFLPFALLCLFLQRCSAQGLDLAGKAFTFPAETDNSYVKLQPAVPSGHLSAVSVCLRYFTDLPQTKKEQSFFSLATRAHSNGFLMSKLGLNRHQMYIGGQVLDFWGLPDEQNEWNSFCATWESETGLTQIWLNGKPSSRKSVFKGGSLSGQPFIVLGQDQDEYGGGLHKNDALVGQLADVHMWDRVISTCEIEMFSQKKEFQKGNTINWNDLEFSIHGSVVLEYRITSKSDPQDSDSCPTAMTNLSGKAFTFGAETADSYVKLKPNLTGQIDSASVCLRYFSDIPDKGREQTFFSLATRSHSNGFLLCKQGRNRHQMYIGSAMADFWGLPDELNQWNSFCATWESTTGLTQIWVNGKPSSRKTLFKGGSLVGTPAIVLGQDQDAYGGRFSSNDALIGQLTDVHMWDRVIQPCEIKQFSEYSTVKGGNVIDWQALDYTTYGNVIEEGQINENISENC